MIRSSIYIAALSIFLGSCSPHMPAFESKADKKERSKLSEHYFTEGMKFFILNDPAQAENWFKKALELTPDNAALNFMLGKIYLGKRDLNQALLYTDKALKEEDRNEHYYEQLIRIYKEQANLAEVARVYRKMISVFPGKIENYQNLAAILLYQRKNEEALSIYEEIGKKFGSSPELSKQKKELYLRLNKEDAAVNEARNLARLYPDDVSIQLSYIELLIDLNRKEEARTELIQLREKEPDNPYATFIMANLHREKGEEKEYFELLSLVFRNPEMGLDTKVNLLNDLRTRSGGSKEMKKQIGRLAADLQEAHPDDPNPYMIAGDLMLENNEKKEAWQQYLKAKNIDKTNYRLWYQLIVLDSELGKTDSMIVHSEQALEAYPNQAALWYLNGTAYLLSGKPEDAIPPLEQGKRLAGSNPQLQLQFNIMLGDSYNELKDYDKSDSFYEEALEIDASNPHVLNNYSYFLSLRNTKMDRALEMAEKLITIAPENAAYIDTYAWVLYKLERYEEARNLLEKAILNTNDGTIVEHYGDVLYKLGEKDKAVSEWIKASKLGQTSELIQQKISDRKLYE